MRKLFTAIVSFIALLSLAGCNLFTVTTDELLSPPAPAGELFAISNELKNSAPENYVLKYPKVGEKRSAILLEDLDGDKTDEAIAFYSTAQDDVISMHIKVIKKKGDSWKSTADTEIIAGDIEKVEFCDLDGDKKEEILVGWEIYGSTEKSLGVYSFEGDTLKERFIQKYTTFLCCDLVEQGKSEIFLQYLNQNELSNTASLYSLKADGVTQTAGCILDGTVKTVSSVTKSALKNGQKAIFVEETKGLGAVTEVLFMKDGELVNPLLDKNTLENAVTLRGANIKSADINGDGFTEIPTAVTMPSVNSGEEKFYYTNWCSFDGENMAIEKVSYFNTSDGYYLDIDQSLTGKLAVLKDSESRKREFYYYNGETEETGEKLFSLFAVDTGKYERFKEENKNAFMLNKTETTVYAAEIYETDYDVSVNRQQLNDMFKMIN